MFSNERGAGNPPAQTNSGTSSEEKQSLLLNASADSLLRELLIKTNAIKWIFFTSRPNKTRYLAFQNQLKHVDPCHLFLSMKKMCLYLPEQSENL